jgi:DNA-binding MarR family transcriptional regulator
MQLEVYREVDSATIPTDRRPIGFWLKLVDRLIDERFDQLLAEEGLTRRHWQVLAALQAGPASVQQLDAKLAPFLDQREPTTRPVLDDLCARGWAAWSSGDLAIPTQAGATAHTALLAKVSGNRRQLTAGITPDDYLATVDVLRRMATNLGWNDPGGGPSR